MMTVKVSELFQMEIQFLSSWDTKDKVKIYSIVLVLNMVSREI
tara:strand:+ start:518 stop:646 length:129 start_codon:yes stop_codon:yes gene_type:complete